MDPSIFDHCVSVPRCAFVSGRSMCGARKRIQKGCVVLVAILSGSFAWPSRVIGQAALEPPTASPSPGLFGASQVVTLQATAGVTIRYTLDGSEPTDVSTPYSGPITVNSSTLLRARAFQNGWTPSPVMSAFYEIDVAPPIITSTLEPAPNAAGWNRTPVKVSFSCFDRSAVVCPESVLLTAEGAGQVISRTVVDTWGREGSTSVTVNIDFTPPSVGITSPSSNVTTTSSTISISGQVDDVLSGVAATECNGTPASASGASVSCEVQLTPGRNAVVLHSRDVAGNTSSQGIRVIRSMVPVQLSVTPTQRVMRLGEAAQLSVISEAGEVVDDVTWTSSDPAIATITTADGFIVTALATGQVTLTASWQSLTAEASVTVIGGASWPTEAPRWTLAPTPGFVLDPTAIVYAQRVTETGPDLFLIEASESSWEPEFMHAVRADGTVLWTERVPGRVRPWWLAPFGDVYGGVVAPVLDEGSNVVAFVRFGGEDGVAPWRHDVQGWVAAAWSGYTAGHAAAQAADGTIYYVEGSWTENRAFVVGLDGATGSEKFRVPVPTQRYTEIFSGLCASWQTPPVTVVSTNIQTAPAVGADGAAYVQIVQLDETWEPACGWWEGLVVELRGSGTITVNERLSLMRVDTSGVVSFVTLRETSQSGPDSPTSFQQPVWRQAFPNALPGPVAFDDSDGVLATWYVGRSVGCSEQGCSDYEVETHISRAAPEVTTTDHLLYTRAWVGDGSDFPTPVRLVGDQQTAFLQDGDTVSAVDVTSWATKWTVTGAGSPLATGSGGEVALFGADGVLSHRDSNGQTVQTLSLPSLNPSQVRHGIWTGLTVAGELATYVSLPLSPPAFSFAGSSEFAQRGTAQAARRPATLRFATREEAALKALDYLYPLSALTGGSGGAEWAAVVCEKNQGFEWSRFFSNLAPDIVLTPNGLCNANNTYAAHVHTHPLPWGFHTFSGLDLSNGDVLTGIPRYVRAPSNVPNPTTTHTMKTWNSGDRTAQQNVCELASDGTWHAYSGVAGTAGARCDTPQP